MKTIFKTVILANYSYELTHCNAATRRSNRTLLTLLDDTNRLSVHDNALIYYRFTTANTLSGRESRRLVQTNTVYTQTTRHCDAAVRIRRGTEQRNHMGDDDDA